MQGLQHNTTIRTLTDYLKFIIITLKFYLDFKRRDLDVKFTHRTYRSYYRKKTREQLRMSMHFTPNKMERIMRLASYFLL